MTRKYEITDLQHPNIVGLRRIRALVDISDKVRAGDLGGYVQGEQNLSQEGSCWIDEEAVVSLQARVTGDAQIQHRALITGRALVTGRASVGGNAHVREQVTISGSARVAGGTLQDSAQVSGEAQVIGCSVFDHALISGSAFVRCADVYGWSRIVDHAVVKGAGGSIPAVRIFDRAVIKEGARVEGSASVSDHAEIAEEATVKDHAAIMGGARIRGKAVVGGYAEVSGKAVVEGTAAVTGEAEIHDHVYVTRDINHGIYGSYAVLDGAEHWKSKYDSVTEGRYTHEESVWVSWLHWYVLHAMSMHSIYNVAYTDQQAVVSGSDEGLEALLGLVRIPTSRTIRYKVDQIPYLILSFDDLRRLVEMQPLSLLQG